MRSLFQSSGAISRQFRKVGVFGLTLIFALALLDVQIARSVTDCDEVSNTAESTSCWERYQSEQWRAAQIELSTKTIQRIIAIAHMKDLRVGRTLEAALNQLTAAGPNDGLSFMYDYRPERGQPHNSDCNFYLRTTPGVFDTSRSVVSFPAGECDEAAESLAILFFVVLDGRKTFAGSAVEKHYLAQYPDHNIAALFDSATASDLLAGANYLGLREASVRKVIGNVGFAEVPFPVTEEVLGKATTLAEAVRDQTGTGYDWQALSELNPYVSVRSDVIAAGTKVRIPAPIEGWVAWHGAAGATAESPATAAAIAEEVYGSAQYEPFVARIIEAIGSGGESSQLYLPIFGEDVIWEELPVVQERSNTKAP